ncbi:MAG: Glucose-6-phosphate 1-dehydrogenase [Candidatus Pacebacteria bacterium GW2011_GWF2_38_9]|nr:MAG: Glucose-6-phosphate 1-dehydrogenase [Candidatus Pacebacteria bacterium GW2011_GWF1_36_5]KKQ88739.1 MAG: Glucose-6-phosphate 1-dehydrogenase [Candidatus Pacebacteria bacterium GW2011_GWF2_38_9]
MPAERKNKMNMQESFSLVIFGATGNLAQLKLIPALYDLAEANLLPEKVSIVGIGRKELSDEEFRQYSNDVLHKPNRHHQHPIKEEVAEKLLEKMHYVSGDIGKKELYEKLDEKLKEDKSCSNRMFYLATYPELYPTVFNHLEETGLNSQKCGFVRVIIEKPIGSDLDSAKKLNQLLAEYYAEDQIYRLDHYLGRETLQNILSFRFANNLFEPMINKDHVDHIQITAAEDFGIGMRGGYYDSVGALKDVGQNHILQMIALATMEAPTSFTNQDVTDKRIKLLKELAPEMDRLVFAQYEGYLNERSVNPDSNNDTFFAFRTHINNKRFEGVPIYVRAGKALKRTVTEITIVFKKDSQHLFSHLNGGKEANMLIYRIQPNEGIVLKFSSKTPGPDFKLQDEYMQYCYRQTAVSLPDPYLRLLVDALRGDQTFFVDAEEVEAQWKFIDPLIAARSKQKLVSYKAGSFGPEEANQIIEADGRKWIEPSVSFCSF